MSVRTEWESVVAETITELASGATTISLYGSAHPRAGVAVRTLLANLERLLAESRSIELTIIGEELFVGDRSFTRTARQAAALLRRFRRRGVEHARFLAGVDAGEIRSFLEQLAASDGSAVQSLPHVQVGKIELVEGSALGGPDRVSGGAGRRNLPTFRERVGLVADTFASFGAGRALQVGHLHEVVLSLLDVLEKGAHPLAHFAPWEGERRWPAVHAHNTSALTLGLARMGGVVPEAAVDLGLAAMVHDLGKAFLPEDAVAREIELTGDELELILDHPREGLRYLLPVKQLPPIALIVVLEHHLDYRGTGYPRLTRPRRPHPASRLVSVADSFVNLYTMRAALGLATREGTVAWLEARSGTVFDPDWVAALRKLVGPSVPPAPPHEPG